MDHVLKPLAEKLNLNYRRKLWWRRAVLVMVTVVVFCTTYVLILPAITMEKESFCGRLEHTHTDACYSLPQPVYQMTCEPYEADRVLHTHGALCEDDGGTMICSLPELQAHTHGEKCYIQHRDPVCEFVHTHSEACRIMETVLVCGLEESAPHTHSEDCSELREIPCELEEHEPHIHDESCISVERVLVCTEEEGPVHTHDDGCYEEYDIPCSTPESSGHAHDESCSTMESVLICTVVEGEGHAHSENCYEEQEVPCECTVEGDHIHEESCFEEYEEFICTREEVQLHTHAEDCFDEAGELICQRPVVIAHTHQEDCLVQVGMSESQLICGLDEHIHEDACYEKAEDTLPDDYQCASGTHTHHADCYDEIGSQICTIPEHVHTAECVMTDVDPDADVETSQRWERELSKLTLTGNRSLDIRTVAESQLDYAESEQNVVLEEGTLHGYTRYGEWYGEPYAPWDAMFASFVLHYAGVEDFPLQANAAMWVSELEEAGLYAPAGAYEPKPGDLVFFDYNWNRSAEDQRPIRADHVGLVTELIPSTAENSAQLVVIEGDTRDMVVRETYLADDPTIMGYGIVPESNVTAMCYQGDDYTVTVVYGEEADIPETAQLAVREILPDTAEYDAYYQQSLDALRRDLGQQPMALDADSEGIEEELKVSFARFFDISFLVDGQVIEPAAVVDVQISYAERVPQKAEDCSVAVHFTEEGVELLDTTISQDDGEGDTFAFSQDSFSVVGTMLFAVNRAAGATSADIVNFSTVASGTTYVLYTEYNGAYYAFASKAGSAPGYAVPVTLNSDNTIGWDTNNNEMFWTFTRDGNGSAYYVQNSGSGRYIHPFYNSNTDSGATTSGRYTAQLTSTLNGAAFRATGRDTGSYLGLNGQMAFTYVNSASQAANMRLAAVRTNFYNVWFDGTNGGMMSLYGSDDTNIMVERSGNRAAELTLPEVWKSPAKYDYTLQGWYDINTQTYYPVDPTDDVDVTVSITADTVFYADWVAATYDVGEDNEHVVDSEDTQDFITTHVFDYNVLFNVYSQQHTGNISSAGHSETWSIVNNGGTVPHEGEKSLGFAFVDYDSNGDFSYANGRGTTNVNQGTVITSGILDEVRNNSGGKDILEILFDPNTSALGKNYVGTGNYLYRYMDSTTENYDGIHDGYYYLDARLNAASYNQTEQRFYLYDYLERTSDSRKDGGTGEYSDFLPFNSPYIFGKHQLDEYTDPGGKLGYEYDAKDGENSFTAYNSPDDATTNYFFGIRSDIEFFLPNATNTQDDYGNYGNVSTRGEHMIFDFHGDDDVWVFVDDELLLDIGGLHGVMFGQIDFSTGQVIVGQDGGETTKRPFHLGEGPHTLTVYYMERGSSQSNCAIYFNVAPGYDLEIMKEDIVTAEELDGTVFSVYTDEALTIPAQLWDSYEAYKGDMQDDKIDDATNEFEVIDGAARCWGISAGKTYYICETTAPPGYSESDDLIRVTLNNRGTATVEVTTLNGGDNIATEGLAVIRQNINDTLKIVALTVTNQKDGDNTSVRVRKTWAEGSENIPESVTVYLTGDGERVGREAVLNESNGWSYTWTGLPKYAEDGSEIEYVVEEVLVPDYITLQGESGQVENVMEWVRVAQMSDNTTILLIHDNQALAYNGRFGWMSLADAKAAEGLAAQWTVTAKYDGFRLKNGLGYTLSFDSDTVKFYGDDESSALNQVFRFSNSNLMVHDHDVYYQLGSNGSAVSENGLTFTIQQKAVFTGLLTDMINKPVGEDDQTYVKVNKVWEDGSDLHLQDAVVIHLYADGKSTGLTTTLNTANNWNGGFYDLPYLRKDGQTPVTYTVVEEMALNYTPQYSEPVELPGLPLTLWKEAEGLTAGRIYRFTNGSRALAMGSSNSLISAQSDPDAANQQWEAVTKGADIVLKNVGTGRYLRFRNNALTTTTTLNSATAVTLSGNLLSLSGRYLVLGADSVSLITNSQNISGQEVTYKVETTGQSGIGFTVTNLKGGPKLPATGGIGTSIYTFSGLTLILTAVLMYIILGRKRRREERLF